MTTCALVTWAFLGQRVMFVSKQECHQIPQVGKVSVCRVIAVHADH